MRNFVILLLMVAGTAQVSADQLADAAWNCAALAMLSPDGSAAHNDLDRITGVALASSPTVPTPFPQKWATSLKDRGDEFWRGYTFASTIDLTEADLVRRLPPPSIRDRLAEQDYASKNCALLGK